MIPTPPPPADAPVPLQPTRRLPRADLLLASLAALALALWMLWPSSRHPLVVYCAHDSIYAEKILTEFERRTGIPVVVRFDSEATKSLGLVELLLSEKAHPRCDVFWNNELLGTLQLADANVFLPYKGPGYERIPAAFRDPEGRWTGFAARLRVWIVNTQRVNFAAADLPPADLSRVAVAKPLYGTTRTHYTVLWRLWGSERLGQWHRDWRAHGAREVSGNAAVKDLVAEGVCDAGFTDSDDFYEARDAGKPVAMFPVRVDGGQTICIPNTVSIVSGTRREADARQLVDYLLSAETEVALANSGSHQIPLGPVDETRLPPGAADLKHWADDGYPLTDLGAAPADCLAWLKAECLR